MENLRQGIGLQAVGQRDPLVMYRKEGHEMFQTLQQRIQEDAHPLKSAGMNLVLAEVGKNTKDAVDWPHRPSQASRFSISSNLE